MDNLNKKFIKKFLIWMSYIFLILCILLLLWNNDNLKVKFPDETCMDYRSLVCNQINETLKDCFEDLGDTEKLVLELLNNTIYKWERCENCIKRIYDLNNSELEWRINFLNDVYNNWTKQHERRIEN